jgi:hypothetical protein
MAQPAIIEQQPGVVIRRVVSIVTNPSGHRWSDKLMTAHGERVARVVGAFADIPVSLAPPVRNLDLEAMAAYVAISENQVGVKTVSISSIMNPAAALPDPVRKSVISNFALATSSAVVVPLGTALRRAMGDDCDKDMVLALADDEEIATASVSLPDGLTVLADRANAVVRQAVACQALLVSRGRYDLADKVGEFTRLMRMGNVPLGITSQRTLIVLVA